ncbi:MAG: HU family DNA-binding protein [Chloroflexota bacterium]|nr:HU family DNA-binding protein [Chloroflexota bacterium]
MSASRHNPPTKPTHRQPTTNCRYCRLSVLSVDYRQIRRVTVNHTQRVAHVARQRRSLTKAVVREAVERYLAALADEIASGEWVDIPYIGKIQVQREEGKGYVSAIMPDGRRERRQVKSRLRTKMRLSERFRQRCRDG